MFDFLSRGVWGMFIQWLGIGTEYFIAAGLILGGLYLYFLFDVSPTNRFIWILRPMRWMGIALIVWGSMLGWGTYQRGIGLSSGNRVCQAEWKQKNYEAELARLKQETEAKQIAIDTAQKETEKLEAQNAQLQEMVADYMVAASKLPVCRHATTDDDKRVCKLTGNSAGGCTPPKRLRPSRKTSSISPYSKG